MPYHAPLTSRRASTGISVRVFFGHQSVGADLLTGLSELQPAARMSVVETRSPARHAQRELLAHARIGSNTDPASKIDDFCALLRSGIAHDVDFALFKFCYVDVTTVAAAHAVFERYAHAMSGITTEFPNLTLGHMTIPLRCPAEGVLARVRERISGPDPEHARNRARATFNARLVEKYSASAPLFDLAGFESRLPDGSRHGRNEPAGFVPALAPAYTEDGGHLNARGRRIAAHAFLEFLDKMPASLSRQTP